VAYRHSEGRPDEGEELPFLFSIGKLSNESGGCIPNVLYARHFGIRPDLYIHFILQE
jgi:hypothetical protein